MTETASPNENERTDAAPASAALPSGRSREALALGLGTIAFVVVAVVAVPVMHLQSVPISGPGSLGQYIAIASAIVGVLSFAAGRYVVRDRGRRIGLLDVVDIVVVAVAMGVIALLTWTLLADLLARAFVGADVFAIPSLLLAGVTAALTAYAVFLVATELTLQLLAFVLALFLVEGVLAAMLTAADKNWWKENLSALGMTDDVSALAFNSTLIIAGIIVTTLARHATRGIEVSSSAALRWVRGLLVTIGVFLACVGIFPVDRFFAVHNTVATGMAVAYLVLVIGLRFWIPGLQRGFIYLGWAFLAVVVVVGVFFGVGYYTLTAVELIAAMLIFSWIILFLRNIAALQKDAAPDPTAAPAAVIAE
jgi:hypothetical protein